MSMKADYINPFLVSTVHVFHEMLALELVREQAFIRKDFASQHEVTGLIGLIGKTTGTVAVSLPRDIALAVAEKLLGERLATKPVGYNLQRNQHFNLTFAYSF